MSKKKIKYSSSLVNDARQAMNAVVQIHAQGYSNENIRSILDPRFALPIEWTGTGFFIKIEGQEGFLLTNSHVAMNAMNLQVISPVTSKETFQVDIIGLVKSQEPDIALLKMPPNEIARFKKITGGKFWSLELGDSNLIKRGQEIKAIGYPLGMDEPNISGGEVSNFISGDEHVPERLVTDAAINPGNSGGPSIIKGGKVIGLNTAIVINANNIGFVTPINFAKILFEALITWKYPQLAHLGGKLQKNSEENSKFLKQKNICGMIVTHIFKNSMLENAGLKCYDIIEGINNHKIDRHGIMLSVSSFHKKNIHDIVRLLPLGSKVKIHYNRKGRKNTATTIAIPQPKIGVESQPIINDRKFINFFGMLIQELSIEIISAIHHTYESNFLQLINPISSNETFLAITYIELGSVADSLCLNPGDLIHKIQNQKVNSLKKIVSIVNNAINKNLSFITIETISGDIGCFPVTKKNKLKIEYFSTDYNLEEDNFFDFL